MRWLQPDFWFAAEQPLFLALVALLPLLVLLSRRGLGALGALRRELALASRCMVLLLLILALVGLQAVREQDDETVVFALDTSASVPRDIQQFGFDSARRASATLRKGKDRAALVCFNGTAQVEQLPGAGLHVAGFSPASRPQQTDIVAGLRFAAAILPPDSAGRIVLLSDGNQNAGDALAEVEQLRAAGVGVDVLPLEFLHEREVVFERLTPGRAAAGALPVELAAGANRLTVPVHLSASGLHRFRAVFEPELIEDDTLAANNGAQAFTLVGGQQRVLILRESGADEKPGVVGSSALLANALSRTGIAAEVRTLGELPIDAPTLVGYSCVVLDNVSALGLDAAAQAALAAYVRDLGGGLIVIGGDRSFSMGGYFGTALEEVLPVQTDRDKLTLLSLSMVIVLDRSGSMAGEKLELAKNAARGAVQLLSQFDQLGVIAFDAAARWVVPLGPCSDKATIAAQIGRIASGGGTVMYPALREAFTALTDSNANVRHIILLTDGRSTPGDFAGLAERPAAAGITVSAVAVGADADRELLGLIATATGGRLYITDGARPLPQILARGTVLVSRSGMREHEFRPELTSTTSPLVAGFRPGDFPALGGYVITAAKPLAEVPLVNRTRDGVEPILAHWQVGLGRAVAFTSGMWPRWGGQWLAWPGFAKLWSQAVRWAGREAGAADFDVQISVAGSRASVALEAAPELELRRVGVRFEARVVDPAFRSQPLELRQTGPGRYAGSFELREFGNYILRIAYAAGYGARARSGVLHAGLSWSYSPEWRDLSSNTLLLTEIARHSGGRVLSAAQPDAVFETASIRPIRTRQPLWQDLVRLALLAFLFDVAVRRLAFSPGQALARLRRRIAELAATPKPASAETLATLHGVRQRVRADQKAPETGEESGPAPTPVTADEARQPAAEQVAKMRQTPAEGVEPTPETLDYTERLRRAKRRARGEEQSRAVRRRRRCLTRADATPCSASSS